MKKLNLLALFLLFSLVFLVSQQFSQAQTQLTSGINTWFDNFLQFFRGQTAAPTATTPPRTLQKKIDELSYISDIRLITKEEAIETFRAQNKSNPVALKAINELSYNPLSDSLVIKTSDAKDYGKLKSFLQNQKEFASVEKVTFDENKEIIEKLVRMVDLAKMALVMGIAIFFVAAITATANTLQLIAYTQSDEIEIMKLIGATNAYIILPHFIATLFYAFLGSLTAFILFAAGLFASHQLLSGFFMNLNLLGYLTQNLSLLLALAGGVSLFIPLISILITSRKYLHDDLRNTL